MAQSFDELLFDDVFGFLGSTRIENSETEAECNLCHEHGEVMKMYCDEDHGWVHWKCIKGLRKLTRQEENFEALLDLQRIFGEGE